MPRSFPSTLALAMVLATARTLCATPLLAPAATRHPLAGVTRASSLVLGRAALADLRQQHDPVLPDFPLGTDRTARLVLERFAPFSARARVDVVTRAGIRHPALPDHVYFVGTVAGEAGSRVFLLAARDHVSGFVATGGTIYSFGPDGAGGHASWSARDVDPKAYPPPELFCGNDLAAELVAPPATRAAPDQAPPATGAVASLREAEVAVETDSELYDKFGSDSGTLDYLAGLVAASSAIYERDTGVRLRFSYIRLWDSSDPWSGTTPTATLTEVRNYWTDGSHSMNTIAGRHDLVHMISGKPVQGGVAYVDVLCNASYGFGVSQVFGETSPAGTWDLLVVTHELGHNFGSVHSHCYDPPLDQCYNQEAGCYSGPVVASRGTIMSYCHLLSGGMDNIDFEFGDVVSGVIRDRVASATCLAAVDGVCGDGVRDAGEECDDGNTTPDDGCSPTCRLPPRCGDGRVDAGEECDDGNTTDGDGCSSSCIREPRCGDGVLDPGEGCDDGNTTSGDGCSATCVAEPCKVVNPGQTIWVKSKLAMRHRSRGRGSLNIVGDFAIAVPVRDLTLGTSGLVLMIESGDGTPKLELTLPPSHWAAKRGRWLYRDPAGTVGGIRQFLVRDRTSGGLPEVEFKLAGRGTYTMAAADMPLAVTVVLGDAAAGEAGACGRYAFAGGSCGSAKGGSKLLCR